MSGVKKKKEKNSELNESTIIYKLYNIDEKNRLKATKKGGIL